MLFGLVVVVGVGFLIMVGVMVVFFGGVGLGGGVVVLWINVVGSWCGFGGRLLVVCFFLKCEICLGGFFGLLFCMVKFVIFFIMLMMGLILGVVGVFGWVVVVVGVIFSFIVKLMFFFFLGVFVFFLGVFVVVLGVDFLMIEIFFIFLLGIVCFC